MIPKSSRKKLTKTVLEQGAPANGRIEIRDKDSPLVFRLTSTGARRLCVRTRIKGEQTRLTYPKTAAIENLSDARRWARQTIDDCKNGLDPRTLLVDAEQAAQRAADRNERLKFENVLAVYLKRRVRQEKKNRTANEVERAFERYVLPRWRGRPITEITRGDVNSLLDDVFDKKVEYEGATYGGPVAANLVLAYIRACFNWFATQDNHFISPIVPGMTRTKPSTRDRVLTDDEIRALWGILPRHGVYGSIIQTLLFTAQRRDEVAGIVRAEVTGGELWEIPAERYKTKRPHVVPLTQKAVAIIAAQDEKRDHIFGTSEDTAFSSFSKCKRRLDDDMLASLVETATERGDAIALAKLQEVAKLFELSDQRDEAAKAHLQKKWWRLHDLRRTAKTLMQRAGVRPDISERVLGHAIKGVEGVYDKYEYVDEKRDALERLATLLDRIVNPPAANVVALRSAAE